MKGFQRPIHLFTKAASPDDSSDSNTSKRQERTENERKEMERREYEKKLFEKDVAKEGNMSEISQQSGESMSQYDQLENVYAPSATPCYDTPGHNNDSQPPDSSKMCYVDVNIESDKAEQEHHVDQPSNESSTEAAQASRKRNIDSVAENVCTADANKAKRKDETVRAQASAAADKSGRTVKVKGEEASESISAKGKRKDESNNQKVVKESPSKNSNCAEDKRDSRIEKQREQKNGSRSRSEEELKETQRCKLTSDNT